VVSGLLRNYEKKKSYPVSAAGQAASGSRRICEETSGEVYEDVWRLGDEPSWLFRERVTHSGGSKPNGSGGGPRGGSNTATTIDYSYKFDRELVNFNDGYEIRTTVDKDLILVQYSSDAPDASLCYWTTVDEANGITTLNDYMDKLALSKDWGNRNTVKVARVPAGTEVRSFSNLLPCRSWRHK